MFLAGFQSIPGVAILSAGQKDGGLWGQDWAEKVDTTLCGSVPFLDKITSGSHSSASRCDLLEIN